VNDSRNITNPAVAAETDETDDAVVGRAFRRSLSVIVLFALIGGSIAWWWNRPRTTVTLRETKIVPAERRQRNTAEIPDIPFADVTRSAGIAFVHENGATGDKLLPETMGGGCAFLDYDGDGDQDILFVNSRRWPWDKRPRQKPATMALYRNDGTGRFDDVTARSGLDISLYGMGVAVGDYDNDGRTDVYISALGTNRLFHNTGGKFVDVTETAGVGGGKTDWSTGCGWLDFDNDGDLDLFVANYVVWSKEFDLAQNFQLKGVGRAYGRPLAFDGTWPVLYRNDGHGRFTDVSRSAGVRVNNPLTGKPMAKSLGVTFADFDDDGRIDIFVSNDTVRNFLFHNRGDGTFEEIGRRTGIAFDPQGNARGAMGLDVSHFRNDDDLGIAIGNFALEMSALYVSHDGQLAFTDDAVATGLGPNSRLNLTFGVLFCDVDLDGRPDLFAANGHLERDINLVQPSQHYRQSPQLFYNAGPDATTEFVPVPADKSGTDFVKPMVGRGAAVADIDGDGDLDILIGAAGEAPRLLRNDQQTGHHWIRFQLTGTKCNRSAIGARIKLRRGTESQTQQVMPTRSYLSQSELPVTFGLGNSTGIDAVTITWPDGSTQTVEHPRIDRLHRIRQP